MAMSIPQASDELVSINEELNKQMARVYYVQEVFVDAQRWMEQSGFKNDKLEEIAVILSEAKIGLASAFARNEEAIRWITAFEVEGLDG